MIVSVSSFKYFVMPASCKTNMIFQTRIFFLGTLLLSSLTKISSVELNQPTNQSCLWWIWWPGRPNRMDNCSCQTGHWCVFVHPIHSLPVL